MQRTKRKWDDHHSKTQKKIKKKNIEKAKTVASFQKNQTQSKRRKKAEEEAQGYVDSKTQAKNLMKAEIERLKSAKNE